MYDWLLKNGVVFNTRKLKSLEEVDGYDLVINSSGCGAKYLGMFSNIFTGCLMAYCAKYFGFNRRKEISKIFF